MSEMRGKEGVFMCSYELYVKVGVYLFGCASERVCVYG
jgi:hypothetical protein